MFWLIPRLDNLAKTYGNTLAHAPMVGRWGDTDRFSRAIDAVPVNTPQSIFLNMISNTLKFSKPDLLKAHNIT
jgi:hypothetical protein